MECFSSLELEKRRLMSEEYDVDPVFVCVDPYDVNPLYASKVTMRDSPSGSRAPAHYAKIKLEMEEFGDLSPFVQTRHASVNSVDELVTPIFDKDAFDFGTNTATTTSIFLNTNVDDDTDKQQQQQQQQQQHQQQQLEINEEPFVKLERELLASACSFAKRDNPIGDMRQQGNININNNNNNNIHIINNNSNNNNISNSNSNATTALFFATNDNVSNIDNNVGGKGRLSLNVNVRTNGSGFDLTTPSIIEEVVDLEAATRGVFDIFSLIEKEDPEGVSDLRPTPAPPAPAPLAPPRPIVKREPSERKRRRRLDQSDDEEDDDDEDYSPPAATKSRRTRRKYDADDDSESERDAAPRRRRSSFSSECSETSKYRELRDKNNEASRKSRLKRKLKELELESEAEELGSRNVKLKAQVEELEKLVTNFRENLFRMMMARK